MLSKERIAEFRAAPNSISPLDFVLLCQQAEEAIDLREHVTPTTEEAEAVAELSENPASISDGEGVDGA